MRKRLIVPVLIALAAIGVVAASAGGHATNAKAVSLKLHTKKGLGTYVVDSKGHTLYLFEKDKGTVSSCYGSCARAWAPYVVTGKPTAASGLTAKVSTTTRKDGTKQVTYGGHPLYHYDDDKKAGQTEGQGSNEFGAKWYVLRANGKKLDPS